MRHLRLIIQTLDQAGITTITGWPASLRPLMIVGTAIGQPIIMTLTIGSLVTATAWGHHYHITALAAITLVMLPLSAALKLWIRRHRPATAEALGLHTYSFPSGHSFGSLLVLGLLLILSLLHLPLFIGGAIAAALGCLIIIIGLSRIYLGAHYPTDVLAGWLLGLIVLGLIVGLAQ